MPSNNRRKPTRHASRPKTPTVGIRDAVAHFLISIRKNLRRFEDSKPKYLDASQYYSRNTTTFRFDLVLYLSTMNQVTLSAQKRAVEQSRNQDIDIANDTVRHMRICSSSSTIEKKPHES